MSFLLQASDSISWTLWSLANREKTLRMILTQWCENDKDDMNFSNRILSSSFDKKSKKKSCIVLGASGIPTSTTGMELPNPWQYSYCLIYGFEKEHYSPTMPSFKLFQVVYFRKLVKHFLYEFVKHWWCNSTLSLPYLYLVFLLILDLHYTHL